MAIGRDVLEQLRHLVRPLATRVANMVARGVVQLVADDANLQRVQVGVLAGEDIDDAEHHQPYGFASVPLVGAEAVLVFPAGDRAHPLAVVVSDRRSRPTDGAPGDVTVYNAAGAKVRLLASGDIEVQPATGGQVLVRSDGGAALPLVTKDDFDAHTHPAPGGATSPPTTPAAGTTVLAAE